jgi:hypothetical protein
MEFCYGKVALTHRGGLHKIAACLPETFFVQGDEAQAQAKDNHPLSQKPLKHVTK